MQVVPATWTMIQTVALPDEGIFAEVRRPGAWRGIDPLTASLSDGWTSPHSLGLACPVCCKVWCIIASPLSPPGTDEIQFHTSCCREHTRYSQSAKWRIDASILIPYSTLDWGNFDEPLLWALPAELVKREFDIHLDYYSKELAV